MHVAPHIVYNPVLYRGLPLRRRLGVLSAPQPAAVCRWFNGMQLASMAGSAALFYWQFSNKKANALALPPTALV